MRALATITAALLSITLSSPINAQDLGVASAAYLAGDYEKAIEQWRPLAEQGNAEAQFFLGQMYFEGRGVLEDYEEAARYFRLAAEQGDRDGQLGLAGMYAAGLGGLPQSHVVAYMWANLAHSQGAPQGARMKSLIRTNGGMTPADIARAQQLSQECLERNYQGC